MKSNALHGWERRAAALAMLRSAAQVRQCGTHANTRHPHLHPVGERQAEARSRRDDGCQLSLPGPAAPVRRRAPLAVAPTAATRRLYCEFFFFQGMYCE